MKAFGLSKQYYSFNYQNVHVITMATEMSYSKGSSHYNFVVENQESPTVPPKIPEPSISYPGYKSVKTGMSLTPLGNEL
jgi:hypothetical protein